MKKLLVWAGVILVLLLSISAVTVYRIRDIKGDITGAPTLRQELNNRYLKTVADTTFVKISDGFQLHDSIYFKDETDALLVTKAPLAGSVRKVLYNNTQLNNTGNTTENTVFTGTIPANSIGANGSFHITMLIGSTNNANAKTVRVKFNGTVIGQGSVVSAMCYQSYFIIRNRNSLTSQVSMYGQSGASGTFVQGTTAGLPATYAINTAADITVTVTIQNATGSDTVSLDAFEILAVQ